MSPNLFGKIIMKMLDKGPNSEDYKPINKNLLGVLQDIHLKVINVIIFCESFW